MKTSRRKFIGTSLAGGLMFETEDMYALGPHSGAWGPARVLRLILNLLLNSDQ